MKTAVEWYNQQIVDRQNGNGDSRSRDEIFEQAKEMEKEQMIEFGELVWKNLLRSDKIMKSRDVYNETFKQQEQ